jgi:NAD(P)-dependent dehydrogenase (short-subunit alcohol dehydrogenase family)
MPLNLRLTQWDGQVVWLVGASTGIGRAMAEKLCASGAQVIVSARSASSLAELEAAHPSCWGLPLDVTDRSAMQEAMRQIMARYGRLDVTVYCAGYYKDMRATAFDLDDAMKHLQVNVVGALHWLDVVLPVLTRQRSGHLSLISSVAGFRGLPKGLAYGPTKAALINLAEALYIDLKPLGVGVSVINPGFVDTPLTAQNQFAMPALISTAQAADAILRGWSKGLFEIHFPKRFTLFMKALRHLNYSLYFRVVRGFTGL